MSWHDNHVHGFRIVEGADGAGELILDLDYIVEWLEVAGGYCFRMEPSSLRFLGVTDLRVELDYATPSAALTPFSIHSIDRKSVPRDRYIAQVWTIVLNWPNGAISFEAIGYEQTPWGRSAVSSVQRLRTEERIAR
jgi:hypothetical protein